jgi:serine/threonine-protein kinase
VLYECLTGAPPYDADTATEIVARMVDAPPVPVISILPDVNPAISALVAQLLSFEAKDRPQTARELVERLRELS